MGLRDVQEVMETCDGLPAGTTLDGFARHLTVGDLRSLLYCAEAVLGVASSERRAPAMEPEAVWLGRAD